MSPYSIAVAAAADAARKPQEESPAAAKARKLAYDPARDLGVIDDGGGT